MPSSEDGANNAATEAADFERAWQWVHFWQRSYWRRTWIVQELRLAKKIVVHVGPHSMDWADMISARFGHLGMHGRFDGLARKFIDGPNTLRGPQRLLSAHLSWQSRLVPVQQEQTQFENGQLFHGPSNRQLPSGDFDWEGTFCDIFSLVGTFKHSFCQDRRDRIYALHALEDRAECYHALDTWIPPPVRVDYTISLPELVLSLLGDRYVNQPPGSATRRRLERLLLRLGLSEAAIEKFMSITSFSEWSIPDLDHLFDELDFRPDECHTLSRLALERSQNADDRRARRYRLVSDNIVNQFKGFSKTVLEWEAKKKKKKPRWAAGNDLGFHTGIHPPSEDEDVFLACSCKTRYAVVIVVFDE